MFGVESSWRPTPVTQLPSWRGAKRVAVDVETCDPLIKELGPGVRRGGFLAGISFAIEDGPGYYLPIAHEGGDNLPKHHVLDYLRDEMKGYTGTVVGMKLSYDLDYLAEQNCIFRQPDVWYRDVGVSGILINELHPRNSLDDLLARAGLPLKNEAGLIAAAKAWGLDPKADMWKLPARHVAKYAIGDAQLPLALLRRHEREIEKQDLQQVWDLESKVLPVCVKVRRRGVRIDLDKLDRVCHWALGEEEKFLGEVRRTTGVHIPTEHLLKKEHTARALQEIGVVLPATPTGQPKTDADTLIAIDHDVARWILRAKKFHKMRCDFAGSIRKHMVKGRVHSTIQQVKGTVEGKEDEKGAAYGRTSMIDPALQTQYNPEKEPEISGMWRQIFIPDDGATWACGDFSAQEPRMVAHYADACGCDGAAELVAKYRANPNLDLHAETAALCQGPFNAIGVAPERHRKSSKAIFLGKCYGMGDATFCRRLGLPTAWAESWNGKKYQTAGPEGRKLLDAFDMMVPFLKQLSTMCKNRAKRYGYIRTILGRKCRFPLDRKKSRPGALVYDWAHKALNRVVQGGSGDQGKQAMVDADAAGIKIQIPVHDELDASVESRAEGKKMGEIMENAIQLRVPMVVQVKCGPSWGEVS